MEKKTKNQTLKAHALLKVSMQSKRFVLKTTHLLSLGMLWGGLWNLGTWACLCDLCQRSTQVLKTPRMQLKDQQSRVSRVESGAASYPQDIWCLSDDSLVPN